MRDIIDFEAEKARLNNEIAKITKQLDGIGKKLNNADFLTKAPDEVVNGVREKQSELAEKKSKLETHLSTVTHLASN